MISHDSLDRADFRVSYSQYEAFGRLSGIELCWYFPTFCFFREETSMSNIKDRERFEKFNNVVLWKRSKLDSKGRIILPKPLREKLGVRAGSQILWIQCLRKENRVNEFVIEVGVKQ